MALDGGAAALAELGIVDAVAADRALREIFDQHRPG